MWFDAAKYGQAKLLAGAAVPWSSPAELAAFVSKLQGMFRSDAILVDVADLLAQRVSGDERLRVAMAARTRPGYALRTLLADEQARATAAEAIRALASTKGAVPLLLTTPTPARWLAAAARQALSDPGPPDPDRAEVAAMYAADFLRTFGGAAVDGLLLDERPAPMGDLIHPETFRSVLNVADNYGWPVVVRNGVAAAWPHGSVSGVAAWLGSAAPAAPSGRWGIVAGAEFWGGADPPAEAGIVLATVPGGADPEAVMKRVRALA
jgi:hypothetical protein